MTHLAAPLYALAVPSPLQATPADLNRIQWENKDGGKASLCIKDVQASRRWGGACQAAQGLLPAPLLCRVAPVLTCATLPLSCHYGVQIIPQGGPPVVAQSGDGGR